MRGVRHFVGRLAEPFGLLPLLMSLYSSLLYAKARVQALGADVYDHDGLPVPPPRLLFLVTNECDPEWYFASGLEASTSLQEALRHSHLDVSGLGPLLDFGCGCGRVIRRWKDSGLELHGTDVNPRLVEWCTGHLGFAQFAVNDLAPPLAYADGTFGLIYAFSVFTHLPAELEKAWLAELRRVLRPGGILALSTHGSAYLGHLSESERTMFERGMTVVRRGTIAGSNFCTTFHPEQAVREQLALGFEIVDFLPQGARGNPVQDLVLLRRPV